MYIVDTFKSFTLFDAVFPLLQDYIKEITLINNLKMFHVFFHHII